MSGVRAANGGAASLQKLGLSVKLPRHHRENLDGSGFALKRHLAQ
jgi:hypothetical protein